MQISIRIIAISLVFLPEILSAAPIMLVCQSYGYTRDTPSNTRSTTPDTALSIQVTFDHENATVSLNGAPPVTASISATLIDWTDAAGVWHIDRLTGKWTRNGQYLRDDYNGHMIRSWEVWFGACEAPKPRRF